MSLSLDDFDEFFEAVNAGRRPFPWQRRLLDLVVERGSWPDLIDAPTGAGKSSAVDVHVFASALSAAGAAPRLPRRFVVVVNRRALVDQHYDHALKLQLSLAQASGGVLSEVASSLADLAGGDGLLVASLRGGEMAPLALSSERPKSWMDDPRRCAVISATPDMFGSNLLFRGYRMTRNARPRAAGLLSHDTVMMLDEAHLNRQLFHTTAGVVAGVRRLAPILGDVPPLQVVATTATPAFGPATSVSIGVTRADLEADPGGALARRLTRPKRITYHALVDYPAKATITKELTTALAEAAYGLAARAPVVEGTAGTILCVLNTVEGAIALADRLASDLGAHAVPCWVGRLRPLDLARARSDRPGLFTVQGDHSAKFLVATQTVEVGVDLDCAGLLTELAPAAALAQRLGRVNRLGLRQFAECTVVGPNAPPALDKPPYSVEDLNAAYEWLAELGKDADVSPWSLTNNPPPSSDPARIVLSDLNPEHGRLLAHTTLDLFEEPALEFWLRDDLASDPSQIGFVVRTPLPESDASALALLKVTPYDGREVFPAGMAAARRVLDEILAADVNPRAFLVTDEGVEPVDEPVRLRPGDVFIVDGGHRLTLRGVIPRERPAAVEPVRGVWGSDDTDVAQDGIDPAGVLSLCRDLLAALPTVSAAELQDALQETIGADHQVTLPPPELVADQELPWVVLRAVEELRQEAEIRQDWSPSRTAVTLTQHSSAVAARARRMAVDLGLPEDISAAMDLAGAHHDDGKVDPRFQRGALGASGAIPLAKSRERSAQQVQRDKRRGGLPPGWRHEQLSAAYVLAGLAPGPARDLVCRLAGTSHGRGRPFFPHGAGSLLDPDLGNPGLRGAVDELFATGSGWDDILTRTEKRFGPWGCAFLEAVFRAADGQVSAEGS